jgi:hypothetical protein
VPAFQTIVVRSSLVVANVDPSAAQAIASTAPVCWRARPRWVPVATSHTATSEPSATRRVFPSGLTVRPSGTPTLRPTVPVRPSVTTVSWASPSTTERRSVPTVIVVTSLPSVRTSARRVRLHTSTAPDELRMATESPSASTRPASGIIGPNGAPTGALLSRSHSTVPGLPDWARSPKASSRWLSGVNSRFWMACACG